MTIERCATHPDASAVETCRSCGRGLCGACWTKVVDHEAWCDACVRILDEPVSPLAYAATAIVAIAGAWLGTARLQDMTRWIAFGVLVAAVLIAAWRLHGRAKQRRAAFTVGARTPDDEPPRKSPRTYREGRPPLRVRRVTPPVSGALSAWIVGCMMLLVALVFPAALQLPRWLEFEIVVAAWWAIWAGTFVVLLYRGWRVAQDLKSIKGTGDGKLLSLGGGSSSGQRSKSSWLDGLSGGVELEGCLIVIGLIIAFCLAFLLAEFLVPALLLGAYWLIVRGLAAVANDRHECEGHLGRALLWGMFWSAVYTLPLAGMVALGQWIVAHR